MPIPTENPYHLKMAAVRNQNQGKQGSLDHTSCGAPKHGTDVSRRAFLKTAAAASLFLELPACGLQLDKGREFARELPYGAVELTGGPFRSQSDVLHAHYLALDNDRLLKVYRQSAGLPAPGADMGAGMT